MGKRGPKPVDMRKLNVWEFEWYKALHLPRDGTQLRPDPVFVRVNRREAEARFDALLVDAGISENSER